jgi:methylthioribose-1-phosphate isomerase
VRTVDWVGDRIVAIDQTLLPGELRLVELATVDAIIDAIKRLVIRGAPAIGVAGGLGVAVAALDADRRSAGRADVDPVKAAEAVDVEAVEAVEAAAARIRAARPTAVNLAWAVDRVLAKLPIGTDAVVAEAVSLLDEDIAANRALALRGADFIESLVGGAVAIHTHCNAGGLACVEWGTALGIVRALHERAKVREVFADETRPLLQGARLTAFELTEMGVPYRLVVDGAGASVIARGLVDVVVVGADRVAANGDVANKVGTYPLALAAARAGIPFIVAAPESTVDLATPSGAEIDIELRDPAEVLSWRGIDIAPAGAEALNLAFDVTPADLVTVLVTERRIVRIAAGERPDGAIPVSAAATPASDRRSR